MEATVNYLKGIGNAITSCFELIINFFKDFINFLKLIAKVPAILEDGLSWLPSELLSAVLFLLAIVILYKILGREG